MSGETFSVHSHQRKTSNIVAFFPDMGENSHLLPPRGPLEALYQWVILLKNWTKEGAAFPMK